MERVSSKSGSVICNCFCHVLFATFIRVSLSSSGSHSHVVLDWQNLHILNLDGPIDVGPVSDTLFPAIQMSVQGQFFSFSTSQPCIS